MHFNVAHFSRNICRFAFFSFQIAHLKYLLGCGIYVSKLTSSGVNTELTLSEPIPQHSYPLHC